MKIIYRVIMVCFLFEILSCEDIMEKDISMREIKLICPPNSMNTYLSTNTFWWDSIENVSFYEFQLVTPNFNNPFKLILDTTVSDNKFIINLNPGHYEWRVRGINSAYETNFSTNCFTIDSSLNLNIESIILKFPIQNDTSKSGLFHFSWLDLYNADYYRFVLHMEDNIIYDTLISDNSINVNLINEATYFWKVKGINSLTETPFSSRNLYIDTTKPSIRLLKEPLNNSLIYDSIVKCQWSHKVGNSIEFDSIFIYTDFFNSNLIFASKSYEDFTSLNMDAGKYYWKVRGYDKAGNQGAQSVIWSFEIVNK